MSYGIKKFRKKPVVIEALQWTGHNATEIMLFVGQRLKYTSVPHQIEREKDDIPNDAYQIEIPTDEGVMTASKLDWIIKGIKGEFYPCKPDIFAATYELVEDEKIDYGALKEVSEKKSSEQIAPAAARYNDVH